MTDLMYKAQIQQMIRSVFESLDLDVEDRAPTSAYSDAELARVPPMAARWILGSGNPVRWAGLRPGETVADVGCGAGVDTVLAARAVAPGGCVVAVDMLPEMCRRARANVAEAGVRASVVEAEAEALPLGDGSVDVVLSNGVVSLSARKARLLAEAVRVLRPGGRVVAADMTLDDEDLPTEVLVHPSAWAG